MVDLTRYLKDGITIDSNFTFRGSSKSLDDLIYEMSNEGLLVDYLETSGELVRVRVGGGNTHRPDKHGEKSGWYTFFQTGDYQNAVYGNWRTGLQRQWSNFDVNELEPKQRQKLKTDLDEAKRKAEEARKKR